MTKPNGTRFEFVESNSRLYYLDTEQHKTKIGGTDNDHPEPHETTGDDEQLETGSTGCVTTV